MVVVLAPRPYLEMQRALWSRRRTRAVAAAVLAVGALLLPLLIAAAGAFVAFSARGNSGLMWSALAVAAPAFTAAATWLWRRKLWRHFVATWLWKLEQAERLAPARAAESG